MEYSSLDKFFAMTAIVDWRDALATEKVVFLFDEQEKQEKYPLIKEHFGEIQPLAVDEIKSLIRTNTISGYSGTLFFNMIMDTHPHLLTIETFCLSAYTVLYEKILKGRSVAEAIERIKNTKNQIERNILSRNLWCVLEFDENSNLEINSNFFNFLLNILGKDSVPTSVEWFKGLYLANAKLYGRKYTDRLVPSIFYDRHGGIEYEKEFNVNKIEADRWQDEFYKNFNEELIISIVRDPLTNIGSALDCGEIEAHPEKFELPFKWVYNRIVSSYIRYIPKNSNLYNKWRIVRFEDLKLHPHETLTKLCDFLHIPKTDTMLTCTINGEENDEFMGTHGYDPAPIYKKHYKYFNALDRYRVEMIHQKDYESWGYKSKYYEGMIYTPEEIKTLFNLPYASERKLWGDKDLIKKLKENITELALYAVNNDLPIPYDEDGNQMVPVKWLKPDLPEGEKLYEWKVFVRKRLIFSVILYKITGRARDFSRILPLFVKNFGGKIMAIRRIFVEKRQGFFDIPASILKDELSETFRLTELKAVRLIHRYDIEGLSDREYAMVRATVFSEPPVDRLYEDKLPEFKNSRIFAMEYLPGQYDQRAASAAECVQLVTGKERPIVKTAVVVVLVGNITDEVFNNIKDYMINKIERQEASLEKPDKITLEHPTPGKIEILRDFLNLDENGLQNMITERGFAMSLKDLKFCQSYFKNTECRPPTITELRVIDTYWSDHCRHTTFTTVIDDVKIEEGFANRAVNAAYMLYLSDRDNIYGETSRPVTLMDIATIGMKSLKKAGYLSDLDESEEINACSVNVKVKVGDKTEDWLLMFKNETHNHPTEIEPFGGAATCLGGAIRDPLSGRSYVYQAMRLTGAADPRKPISETLPGKLPQKKITQGATAGYSSYGNQIGLATGEVHEVYHEGYLAKRMEIGAVIAAAPKENVVRKSPYAGDIVVLVGGRTGRDGLGGATGSSKEHTTESLATCGAEVQKGNPVEERKIQRLFRNPKISKLIKRCNDFGAGGVAVAIGELADGLSIDLDSVPKKYEGLDGTEIAISESQERMAVVLAQNDVETFIKGAEEENLEATPVAYVTDDKTLLMRWQGETIVNLRRSFLDTNGVQEHITAKIQMPSDEENYFKTLSPAVLSAGADLEKAWLNNLSDLNVCSNKGMSERFDSTIGANTVLMPFGGKNQITPAGGAVAKLPVLNGETDTTSVMTYGLNPCLMSWSPFHGALYSVVEAVSKAVALSCDYDKVRLTLQEYFERLGEDEEKWGKPTAALLGALLAQSELKTPAIGGKDSMSGTFMDLNVPPTLAAFAVGVTDAEKVTSPEFKYIGNKVYIIKAEKNEDEIPNFTKLRRNFKAVSKLIKSRKVFSVATIGVGGVAAAVTKMSLGNGIGFKFEKPMGKVELFSADYGSFLLEVGEDTDISGDLKDVDYELLGVTTETETIVCGKASVLLIDAKEAYSKPLEKIFPTQVKKTSIDTATIVPYNHGNKVFARGARIAKPRVFIPVFPGTNCEYDTARAFEKAGAETDILVVKNLTPKDVEETVKEITNRLKKAKILMFPGGFSGGDEPDGSGKFIAAVFRNSRIANEVMNLLNRRDGLILGICNGFQALIKLGLLPYGEIRPLVANSPTLTFNTIGRHVSTMVTTKIVSNLSPWLNKVEVGDIHTIPVSHGEGRFVADAEIIAKMRVAGQIATQYVDKKGQPTMEFPYNPNGSVNAIEGITSPNGRIFGKMGHSERIGENTYKNVPGNYDQKLFEAGVDYFR